MVKSLVRSPRRLLLSSLEEQLASRPALRHISDLIRLRAATLSLLCRIGQLAGASDIRASFLALTTRSSRARFAVSALAL